MRATGKGNAACWNCRFYVVINGVGMCCVTSYNVCLSVKPMKCKMQEKIKK